MGKLQQGSVLPVRNYPKTETKDVPFTEPEKYMLVAIDHLRRSMRRLAMQVDDRTRPVDEYQTQSTDSPIGLTTIETQPQFDQIAERIESILVVGPPNTAFTLQIGDRFLTMTTDAIGKALLAPVSMLLQRNDRRVITSAVAGNWFLELMGWADERY